MRKCDVGGQAVIEGVMMRGSKGIATAIRTSKGNIKVSVKKTVPLTKKYFIIAIYQRNNSLVRFVNYWHKDIKLFSIVF